MMRKNHKRKNHKQGTELGTKLGTEKNTAHAQCKGMSLVELMISMTIGVFILGAATAVYIKGKSTLHAQDTLARMQENARYALDIIRNDVSQAGFWGLTKNSHNIQRRFRDEINTALGEINGDCVDSPDSWYHDLENHIDGLNGDAAGGTTSYNTTCAPDWLTGTDTLVVRHAGNAAIADVSNPDEPDNAGPGKIYIRTNASGGILFDNDLNPPNLAGEIVEDRVLRAHAYFIRDHADANGNQKLDDIPTLSRVEIHDSGNTAVIRDKTEIARGVQDLQIQFGIDTDHDGLVNKFVDPDHPDAADATRIIAARVWLLMRAEKPEVGFYDLDEYVMGGKTVDPNPDDDNPSDNFRRMLVSTTVTLRNAVAN
ncbi:MAG: PilW family protein [Gammaproteobacteria bacterium]|nr:PilW family protein [Gammaproteobacteria bacterium]